MTSRCLANVVGVVAFAFLAPLAAFAAEQVTVERESRIHAEPRLDAPEVAVAAAGTHAEVLGKSGAWLNVRTPSATGWLYSFNVRFILEEPGAAQAPSGAGDSAIGRVFGPRRGINVTSAIGVRGLDKEDLRDAQFSAEEIERLDTFVVSKEAAEESARTKGLSAVQVDYLEGSPQ
jgi:hypothetical protein